METIIQLFQNLINPEWIVQHGGLYIVALIVFIETGLFFGFFLPGDSLLFIAGMIIANTLSPFSEPVVNLIFWISLITVAGVLGNFVGYWFGKKSDVLFSKEEFYAKKGGGAIIIARFLPVIRTFAPIVAGMVKMNPAKFSFYNIIGSFLWVASIISAGFLLGENAWAKEHLEKIVIGIVLLTTGPVLLKLILSRKKNGFQEQSVLNGSARKINNQEIING